MRSSTPYSKLISVNAFLYANSRSIFLILILDDTDFLISFWNDSFFGPIRSIVLFENFEECNVSFMHKQTSSIDIGCRINFPDPGISTCFFSICFEIFFVK